jgi:hypothetical protein
MQVETGNDHLRSLGCRQRMSRGRQPCRGLPIFVLDPSIESVTGGLTTVARLPEETSAKDKALSGLH